MIKGNSITVTFYGAGESELKGNLNTANLDWNTWERLLNCKENFTSSIFLMCVSIQVLEFSNFWCNSQSAKFIISNLGQWLQPSRFSAHGFSEKHI